MDVISQVLETIRTYSPDANLQPVMSAYLLAAKAHAGQTRKSGEAYLSHPLSVARILADLRMDVETIATGLLHDALEDNPITREELEAEMGSTITQLVDGVTKIGKLRFRSKEELHAENFRKMMLAMSKDLRVILVKLSDRLHNMRTLEHHRLDKQESIARETMDVYVPIANRLGIVRLKDELEDLCFLYLHPEPYAEVKRFLDRTQADRDAYIRRAAKGLEAKLAEEGIKGEVSGRAKNPYSIYRKMAAQNLAVEDVPDILAFRVIVENMGHCYGALGIMHGSFPPVPARIKDYIARPKANGYQSLHTTVIGPEQRRIEVQIRSKEMHRVAEEGIASHWQYKEGKLALSPEEVARISRIRELFDIAREAEDATEFMETVKTEFYSDEVFVFTPAGDVKRLKRGATALDFAYAIHSDVGQHCTGAKVNGKMVPLRCELRSADRVEILTSANQQPNRDWLKIAKTGRAISKIRRHLRQQEREHGIRLGRDMLEAELKRYGSSLQKAIAGGRMKEVLKRRTYRDAETLYVNTATGSASLKGNVRRLLPEGVYDEHHRRAQPGTFTSIISRFRTRAESPVLITGEDAVLVNFANCCCPLPGEQVVGFITRGRGITVHQSDCDQLAKMDANRRISVEWDAESGARHAGRIRVHCQDRPGLLANISRVCELAQVNISRAEARPTGDGSSVCTLEVAVRDVGELGRLIKNIEKIKGVDLVQRLAG
ncbi:MAG: bifunctional (p)ppGpp synthetase/guanosine-3',5'-bis(diphosphate) 3'-pyrophosphohydrolase [Deltaproteobacteria bacterium]|nr:bifunctional (p)ppGpp synthetase/guanosine-3',5'-bis(diphosphate) 3'-pyrophosphohydrolase [Deltaproteobacteria bacterium]